MATITFNFPLYIGGELVKTAEYDYSSLRGAQYLELFSKHKLPTDPNPTNHAAMLVIGAGVIVASNPGKGWTTEDFVNNACGSDIWQIESVGFGFFGARPEEPTHEPSGDATEYMRSASTPQ